MKTSLNRNKAKEIIVEKQYARLWNYEKLKILEHNYPLLDDSEYIEGFILEGDLPQLDKETIEIIKSKRYLTIPFIEGLKPIFIEHLTSELFGVTNEYLELQLNTREEKFEVMGEIDKMGKCPCCQFYSIGFGEDGFHEICSLCFWQNGGNGPNYMTLEEAQKNFQLFGAINKTSLQFIDAEGKIKYQMEP